MQKVIHGIFLRLRSFLADLWTRFYPERGLVFRLTISFINLLVGICKRVDTYIFLNAIGLIMVALVWVIFYFDIPKRKSRQYKMSDLMDDLKIFFLLICLGVYLADFVEPDFWQNGFFWMILYFLLKEITMLFL